jgi:hypothetical protein
MTRIAKDNSERCTWRCTAMQSYSPLSKVCGLRCVLKHPHPSNHHKCPEEHLDPILHDGKTIAECMALCDPAMQNQTPDPINLAEETGRKHIPIPKLPAKIPLLREAISADQFAIAEQGIYEMLLADEPDMPDEQRRELAKEGARHAVELHKQEVADGKEIPIYCVCTHKTSEHIGGVGRCKYPDCDCTEAVPSTVKLEVR